MATASWPSAEQAQSIRGHTPVKVQALGHVVLKVRDLQRSESFYAGLLSMKLIS
jgi:catechol-2,3-dioxygenase